MNEQIQQMMALAARGQQQQQVNVGACGPMAYNPTDPAGIAALTGYSGGNVAGCQPAPAAANLVSPGEVYQECFVPLGVAFGVDEAGNIYPESQIGSSLSAPGLTPAPVFQAFPRNGLFYIFGFKTFSDPRVVQLDSSITGDSDYNHLLSSTDAATWNTDECFCPVNWGCISTSNSLKLQAHAVVNPQAVVLPFRASLWGIRRSSLLACSPFGV
jgi:hypothetical protein